MGAVMRKWAYATFAASSAWAGAAAAEDEPIEFSLAYTADVTGVVEGGLTQRGRFLDNLNLVADADLEKLIGWRGAIAHVDVLNNSGGMPNDDAGTLQGVDNIEVSSQRLRLFEAWVEQAWGRSSLRVGLYDLNSEFYANDSAGLLMAPAFGIGSEVAATGPNGPSIFPSTALAVRAARSWQNGFFARAAVLNANASVLGDPDGVDLEFDEGALIIAEAGVEGDQKFAFGVWSYTRRQDDTRELDGFGDPVRRRAQGAYVLYEQALTDPEAERAATAFFRAGVSDGRTTPFEGGWQAGVLIEHVFASRPESALSFGVNQGMISSGYRQNQIDLGAPMDESELQVEITYSDRILPRVTVQPDLQWIRNPGGDRSVADAIVAGLRFSVEL